VSRGVESTDEYSASGLESLELITADLYVVLATSPAIKEGGLSLQYNPSLLLGRARSIYHRYNDDRLSDASGRTLDLNITKS